MKKVYSSLNVWHIWKHLTIGLHAIAHTHTHIQYIFIVWCDAIFNDGILSSFFWIKMTLLSFHFIWKIPNHLFINSIGICFCVLTTMSIAASFLSSMKNIKMSTFYVLSLLPLSLFWCSMLSLILIRAFSFLRQV